MNSMIKKLIKIFSIGLLSAVSILVQADDDHEKARRLLETGDILSLQVILQKAHEIQPGKILEVELESKQGRNIYEVEILTNEGKILEIIFDAQSGEHLTTKNED